MNEPLVPAPPQRGRLVITLLIFAVLFGFLVQRLRELQLEQACDLRDRATRQARGRLVIPAARGSIVDALGNPLSVSLARWNLKADPKYMQDKLTATVELSRLLGIPRSELRAHFESPWCGRTIARFLTDEQAEAVRTLELDHLYLERVYQRTYPQGPLAAHVLGFVGDEGAGGAGVEAAFDDRLAGSPGEIQVLRDARGRLMVPPGAPRVEARPGAHVQLTLVAPLQAELEAALAEAAAHHQAASACGVVVRPGDGRVLALASWPAFDPLRVGEVYAERPEAFRNNVLGFVYESGSTMKPLVAGAAVSDGLVGWGTRVDCEHGAWTKRVGRARRTIHSHAHGILSVAEVVAKSDNIGMAKLGLELGPDRLYHWIERFGFGRPTGIELPGEDAGIMLPRQRWNILGSCMSVPMGHEIAVTPLQMAMAHVAIANDGVWLPPRIVQRVYRIDPDSGRHIEMPLTPGPLPRRFFTAADAEALQQVMALTITEGTGRRARLDGYTSAGKTGTTEKLIDGRYSKDHHIGSFVGFAPVDAGRDPELLCLVVIDDPHRNGHYGSNTAAPVVQRVLQFGLEFFRIPYSEERDLAAREGVR